MCVSVCVCVCMCVCVCVCVWQSRQCMFMCGEIVNCLKWLNSSYGCLLWLFLVWWFIELIGCDVDVLASFPLILFSSSYRPHWVLGPRWGLGRVELYIVAHSKCAWRVQLDGITRHVSFRQKFWTEATFLTPQKFSQQFLCFWSR